MTVIRTLLAVLILAIGAALVVIYSGVYNVAADEPHFDTVRWVLDTAKRNSVSYHAKTVVVPTNLDADPKAQAGALMYSQMCVQCHLAPGMKATPIHQGLKPMPPRFDDGLPEFTAGELFWIVKHGFKMTGMPAWGSTHSDEEIWDIVAFLPRLPDLSEPEYTEMLAAAAQSSTSAKDGHGQGHEHGHEHAHGKKDANGKAPPKENSDQESAQPAATVDMTNSLTFEPRTVEIKRGESVLWKNPSDLVHTVTADPAMANDKSNVQLPEGAETFDSGSIKPGGEYRHTFSVPGRYRYFCKPHEAAGMTGEVIVKE